MNGAEALCRTLEALGADTVFGLPGSQNVALFEALRTSKLRTLVATHELGASFMANGYARASGLPGVLTTIPGPGFTYALTGLAEAFLDSTPVLYVLGGPASAPGRRFQLQALNQRSIVSPLAKRVFDVEAPEEIEPTIREAYRLCRSGEPGPVVVQVSPPLFLAEAPPLREAVSDADVLRPPPGIEEIARRVVAARRPLLYVGQGALDAAHELGELVETIGALVVTTTSARGVLPETHPRVLCFDRRKTEVLNELVERADLVLALGCKFSHNGAHGFRLRLPRQRFVHVDASDEVLGANYDAAITLAADVRTFLKALLEDAPVQRVPAASDWSEEEMRSWKDRAAAAVGEGSEPRIRGLRPPTPAAFFAALRQAMPRESCLVLDSGLHQMLARKHFQVLCARGFLLPTDLQAMGFALPGAIGAKLARPDRPTVALLGDGGFAMSGLELLTAVRERISLTVVVFNDGRYGLIHRQQLGAHGHAYGTELQNPDIRRVAEAAGARYIRFADGGARGLGATIRGKGVTVVEVALRDPGHRRFRRVARSAGSRIKRWLSGRRPS